MMLSAWKFARKFAIAPARQRDFNPKGMTADPCGPTAILFRALRLRGVV